MDKATCNVAGRNKSHNLIHMFNVKSLQEIMLGWSGNLRHWNASVEDPLEKDECRCPQYKISNSKEWISLQFKATLNYNPYTMAYQKRRLRSNQTYQTIQNCFAQNTNSIYRVHGDNKLWPNSEYMKTSIRQNKRNLSHSKINMVNKYLQNLAHDFELKVDKEWTKILSL